MSKMPWSEMFCVESHKIGLIQLRKKSTYAGSWDVTNVSKNCFDDADWCGKCMKMACRVTESAKKMALKCRRWLSVEV